MFLAHIIQFADVHLSNTPLLEEAGEVADECVLGVVALPPTPVVQLLDQPTRVFIVGELGLQVRDAFRDVVEAVEEGASVEHPLVAVGCGDGDEVVGTDVHGGHALLVAGVRDPCCIVQEGDWLVCRERFGAAVVLEFQPTTVPLVLRVAADGDAETLIQRNAVLLL
nr:hypothetical protein [Halorientalis regularis]